jgi:uncharacterized membrane protein YhaH (DUF805 family)
MEHSVESILGIGPENREPSGPFVPGSETGKTSLWSFEGRIGRGSFWAIWLSLMVSGFGVGLIVGAIGAAAGESAAPVIILLYVVWVVFGCWLGLAMQVKRWHDMDHSGLMVLWNFTFIAIPVLFIMMGCVRGTEGPNQYGSDPLGSNGAL